MQTIAGKIALVDLADGLRQRIVRREVDYHRPLHKVKFTRIEPGVGTVRDSSAARKRTPA